MSKLDRRTQVLLQRWERGELSAEHLSRMDPEAASLAELFTRVSALSIEDHIPDVEAGWARLEPRLPDRVMPRAKVSRWLTRPLLAAAIVVGMTSAVAFADPQIGHQFGRVWSAIQSLAGHPQISFGGGHPSPALDRTDAGSDGRDVDHAPGGHPTPIIDTASGSVGDQDGTTVSPTPASGGSGDGTSDGTDGTSQGSQGSSSGGSDQSGSTQSQGGSGSSSDGSSSGDNGSGGSSGSSSGDSGSSQDSQSGSGQTSD
jgi:hypothetical protein